MHKENKKIEHKSVTDNSVFSSTLYIYISLAWMHADCIVMVQNNRKHVCKQRVSMEMGMQPRSDIN